MNKLLQGFIQDAAHQVVANLLKDVQRTIRRKKAEIKKKRRKKRK